MVGSAKQVIAANGQNELKFGDTVTASEIDSVPATLSGGLIESNQTGSPSIIIDSAGAAVVIGNNTTPNDSFTLTESSGNTTQSINVDTSGSANGVTFAGDLVVSSTANTNSLTITAIDDNLIFQGNATTSGSVANSIAIVGGVGSSTLSLTFDTANAGNIIINATVNAGGVNDNITMNVNDSNGGNSITFSQNIGATVAMDILNIGASTTATFNGTVDTDAINISSINTTTFNSTLTTGAIDFAADGTLSVVGGSNITGAITNATTNEGTLTLLGTTTVSGAVGSTGAGLQAINAGTGTATFSSAVKTTLLTTNGTGSIDLKNAFTGDLNFATNATVTLADGFDFTGTITGATGTLNAEGTSTFSGNVGGGLTAFNVQGSGKTVTLEGDLNAATTTISNLATLKFTKASTTVTGAIASSGTGILDVGTADVTVSGAVNLGASATLNITIGDNNGSIIATTTGITLQSGTTLVPTVTGSITSGQAITIIQSTGGVVTIPTVTDNNLRLDFVAAQSSNNLTLTATTVSSSALGLTGTTAEVNDIVDTAFSGDTLLDELNGLSSNAKLNTALETLIPDVNGGAVIGAVSSGRAPLNTVSYRLASLRTEISAGQGLSAGDEVGEGKNFWLQGFGTYVDQSERQGIQGFEASTGGFALGTDKQISNTFRLGLAASYSYTDVDSRLSENQTYRGRFTGHTILAITIWMHNSGLLITIMQVNALFR